MAISRQFSTKNRNIDEYIDALHKIQEANGVHSEMRKALFDPVTNRRINKFERKRLEERGVDLTPYDRDRPCSRKCPKSCISNIERGVFVYSEEDLYDDDDDGQPYICEYCHQLGFDSKYKPEECDTCTNCEDCVEYMNEECDGCGYSTLYNGGMTYSEAMGDSNGQISSMLEDDIDLINNSGGDKPRRSNGGFSVLNY